MSNLKIDISKFNAGRDVGLYDALRGNWREPQRRDDPSWAAGYRSARP
jgi:hypothetical protein